MGIYPLPSPRTPFITAAEKTQIGPADYASSRQAAAGTR
jgi:hypothetical protein